MTVDRPARPGTDDAHEFGTVAFYAAVGRAFVVMCAVIPLLFVVELLNLATHGRLTMLGGILPHQMAGLDGVLFAPFLHVSFDHLLANSVPLILLGTFMLAAGTRRFLLATVIIMLASGLGTWYLTPRNHVVVGASGVLFGWLGYLLIRGILEHSPWNLAVTVLVGLLYGWELAEVVPKNQNVSWQAHLFGFAGGILAALLLLLRPRSARARARAVIGPDGAMPGVAGPVGSTGAAGSTGPAGSRFESAEAAQVRTPATAGAAFGTGHPAVDGSSHRAGVPDG